MKAWKKCMLYTLSAALILALCGKSLSAQSYWDNFRAPVKEKHYAPWFRLGIGPAFLADSDMDEHYGIGQSLLFDWNYLRYHRSWFGLDLYGRFSFRHFEVKKDNIEFMDVGIQEHHLFMSGLDAGARARANFTLLGFKWSYFISAAPRLLLSQTRYRQDEGSFGKNKNLLCLGAVAGTGLEMALTKRWGIFLEVVNGYTPVGESGANVEGMQFFLGATYSTWVR